MMYGIRGMDPAISVADEIITLIARSTSFVLVMAPFQLRFPLVLYSLPIVGMTGM